MAIRGIKNVVGNYTNGEIKVRECTTNEPWGPTTAQLAEVSDLCYQLLHFHEVMGMIEKRLNDKGKNYRHVAKALLVLDYVIKTGPERVIQYWKDKLYIINTLKDFQFTDKDLKDQGRTIRERAKLITVLLNDNELLLAEREKALETKKKFHSGNLNPTSSSDPTSRSWEPDRKPMQQVTIGKTTQGSTPNLSADIKAALPSNRGEEDLQLQLALALSKEEEKKVPNSSMEEDNQIKQAIQQSKTDESPNKTPGLIAPPPSTKLTDPWASLPEPSQPKAPGEVGDPWGGTGITQAPPPSVAEELLIKDPVEMSDPWEGDIRGRLDSPATESTDPWGDLTSAPSGSPALKPVNLTDEIVMGPDPWAGGTQTSEAPDPVSLMDRPISPPKQQLIPDPTHPAHKLLSANTVEEDFLGSSNAKLVNLDALVDLGRAPVSGTSQVGNPFAMLPPEPASKPVSNPFMGNEPPRPTLNQMRDFSHPDPLQAPLIPSGLPPPLYQAPQPQSAYPPVQSSQPAFPPVQSSQPAFPPVQSSQPAFPPVQSSQPAFPPVQSSQPAFPPVQSSQPAFPPVQSSQPAFPPVQSSQPAFPPVQSSFAAPQSSQASDLASLFQTPSVPPSYGFTNPPAPSGLSGVGQTQDYSAFQTALPPNQSVFGTGQVSTGIPPTGAYPSNQSVFGSGQVATGPPAYSAFQTTPVPPGPAPGANYGAGSAFPQSSNPFF